MIRVLDVKRGDYGYESVLFDDQGHVSLVYRATESWDTVHDFGSFGEFAKDWGQNIAQLAGFVPAQYEYALRDAQKYAEDYPDLTLVGHSLGGGLAAYAGNVTGFPVLSVNGAGLGAWDDGRDRAQWVAVQPGPIPPLQHPGRNPHGLREPPQLPSRWAY